MERLTVIIPALNAATTLSVMLDQFLVTADVDATVLVVDSGSNDATLEIAKSRDVAVIQTERGRGSQMAAGGAAADRPWLLFLHADTRLQEGWDGAVARFIADTGESDRAAVFRLRFDDPSPAARRVEWIAARRSRWLGLPYGDQGLLISRAFYESLGGFRPLAIMEDVDMVRRIERRRLVTLSCDAVTSAVRYRRMGYTARMFRNLLCLTCYFLGMPPRWLLRLYG
ncbi:MAG: glycosyltransferase family 2 protein [Rhodospirillaceae bacterium]|nr:glycosyltransferase family 2 protein [Rhodospirillaceae bacterium]MBT6204872.1 glycosyltransferase family 2 protein [Rhodospirillaceae bacterium]MBT6511994.1 glycosyltransferase family 2 protein [Rhodospirillaceae bacterium]MBT7615170.1 glycosyltransferase family 2 protein [Rhodospirillaceae bacterium]MBT7648362.1 glycosyltransferase family 2 protein [Rhodospirillaceae bacterium]